MNKKLLSWLIAFCAIGLAGTAGYYSIIGLSKLFAGVAVAVIIMTSFLELSKLTIATLLHSYWGKLNNVSKSYFVISLITLSILTSIGIYGMLSSGYKNVSNQLELNEFQTDMLTNRKTSYQEQLDLYSEEKSSINSSITDLQKGLSNNKIQYIDKTTGQLVNTTSSNNRKSFEKQLDKLLERKDQINIKTDSLNSKIFKIEEEIFKVESQVEVKNELGPLKYLSQLTGQSMDGVVNWLLLIIMFVFDPLAIALVIAANFSFEQITNKKKTLT
jgi:hypothetical protein